ncbi:Uma2 family endonuclease [Sodalinema gerasimenkoae]|uniref:Uma2 family endonuclease n=1 Tax=Sodalinema gerasimenkoae TaxID=2862348 RepID=UPI00135968B6|nr:Uma2 family endonuclease [Sodalinema gerasimenkoae]
MLATSRSYNVTWDLLPDDAVLPDEPVDKINQPALAAALTESLQLAGRLPETALASTNYGICATLDGQLVIKAPDWAFMNITVTREEVVRSYTPNLQGDPPVLVLEFLSNQAAEEYSIKETYPPGKFFFYEKILQVPNYGIFDLESGSLELYRLDENQAYQLDSADENGRFWIPQMELFLGSWRGCRENRDSWWLRWWDEQEQLLLWGIEQVERERQRADAEQQRAERLLAQLRAAGLDPED